MKRVTWLQGRQDYSWFGRSNPLSKYQIGFWHLLRFKRELRCCVVNKQRAVGVWRMPWYRVSVRGLAVAS